MLARASPCSCGHGAISISPPARRPHLSLGKVNYRAASGAAFGAGRPGGPAPPSPPAATGEFCLDTDETAGSHLSPTFPSEGRRSSRLASAVLAARWRYTAEKWGSNLIATGGTRRDLGSPLARRTGLSSRGRGRIGRWSRGAGGQKPLPRRSASLVVGKRLRGADRHLV